MNEKAVIAQAISLFHKEYSISSGLVSEDLLRASLRMSGPKDSVSPEFMTSSSTGEIRSLLLRVLGTFKDNPIDLKIFMGEIRLCCEFDTHFLDVIIGMIGDDDCSEKEKRSSIVSIKDSLAVAIKDDELASLLSTANRDFRFNRDSIQNKSGWIDDLTDKIKSARSGGRAKRKGLMDLADFDNVKSIENVFSDMKSFTKEGRLFKTGWKAINDMFHGGLRRGEFVVCPGLPHKYKSGFNLSLFRHLVMYNNPHAVETPGKKPLAIRISLEDDLHLNFKHLYKDIRMSKGDSPQDILNIDDWPADDLAAYVKGEMCRTGFSVAMIRANPSDWTYRDAMDIVEEYENQGYEVQILFVDYLAMLPTTGCAQGAIGADVRDMFQKYKNYSSEKKILFVTPHQINPYAKELLLKGSLKDSTFVSSIPGRGLYLSCKSLDNEIDVEINIHTYDFSGETYFTVGWGKHRGFVTDYKKKFVCYKFPKNEMPIPSDLMTDFNSGFSVGPSYDEPKRNKGYY